MSRLHMLLHKGTAAVPSAFPLGTVLIEPSYGNFNQPPVDIALGASDLFTQYEQTGGAFGNLPDANRGSNGWPSSTPAGGTGKFRVTLHPVAVSQPYVLQFSGPVGAVSIPGATGVDTSQLATLNKVILTPPVQGAGVADVDYTVTGGGYPTFTCRPQTDPGGTFDTNFVSRVNAVRASNGAIRFPKWTSVERNGQPTNRATLTNPVDGDGQLGEKIITWANRNPATSPDWKFRDGVPVEMQTGLCAAAQAPGHFNLPWISDWSAGTYYDGFAGKVCDMLDANPAITEAFFELSLEIWNFGYPVCDEAQNEGVAAALTIPAILGGGTTATNTGWARPLMYAYRSYLMWDRIKAVFTARGHGSKFRSVLAWHIFQADTIEGMLQYLQGLGKLPTDVQVAPYYDADGNYDPGYVGNVVPVFARTEQFLDDLVDLVDTLYARFAPYGVRTGLYETGPTFVFNPSATRNAIATHELQYALQVRFFERLKALRSSVPSNVFATIVPTSTVDAFGFDWGVYKNTKDTATLATAPRAIALADFKVGTKKLKTLYGELEFIIGDPNGTTVGYLTGGTNGSTFSTTNPNFSINNTTRAVTLTNTSAYTVAVNVSLDIVETLAGVTGSPKTTTLTVKGYTLGSELIVNGTFATTGSWTLYTGASISGGKLNCSGCVELARQAILTSAKRYRYSYDYTRTSGADLRLCNGTTAGVKAVGKTNKAGASGTFTDSFTAADVNFLLDASGAAFSGTIDNVSCKEMVGAP